MGTHLLDRQLHLLPDIFEESPLHTISCSLLRVGFWSDRVAPASWAVQSWRSKTALSRIFSTIQWWEQTTVLIQQRDLFILTEGQILRNVIEYYKILVKYFATSICAPIFVLHQHINIHKINILDIKITEYQTLEIILEHLKNQYLKIDGMKERIWYLVNSKKRILNLNDSN